MLASVPVSVTVGVPLFTGDVSPFVSLSDKVPLVTERVTDSGMPSESGSLTVMPRLSKGEKANDEPEATGGTEAGAVIVGAMLVCAVTFIVMVLVVSMGPPKPVLPR